MHRSGISTCGSLTLGVCTIAVVWIYPESCEELLCAGCVPSARISYNKMTLDLLIKLRSFHSFGAGLSSAQPCPNCAFTKGSQVLYWHFQAEQKPSEKLSSF